MKTFENLAGLDACWTDPVVSAELAAAGIPETQRDEPPGEVQTWHMGRLQLGPHVVRFWRAWMYWRVACDPAIPHALAVRINDDRGDFDGSKYSGDAGRLGDVVRVEGYAGGMDPRPGGVASYHVDSPAGLARFVAILRAELASTEAAR
jgi:hypothetical protein